MPCLVQKDESVPLRFTSKPKSFRERKGPPQFTWMDSSVVVLDERYCLVSLIYLCKIYLKIETALLFDVTETLLLQ